MQKIIDFVDGLLAKSTPEAPAWNIEQALENKPVKWNYVDGCMIKAVLDLHYATGKQKYFDFAKIFIDFYLADDGILGYRVDEYNCDNINMGKVLFDLHKATKDEKYTKAIILLHSQLLTHPRTEAGNFWHKKIYPSQVWLDGLYMVQPFYMDYEMQIGGMRNYKDIFQQFATVQDIMRDKETGLLYHGYDESRQMFWADKTTGLSPNFWTRSIGWYIMALADTAEKLDERCFYEYDALQGYLKETLDAVLKFADPETNLFYQVTNAGAREGNYLETSGSCAIAYALMKGARLGYLPDYYFDEGLRIFESVVKHKLVLTDDSFALKDICLVAGLGGMPGKGGYKLRDGTFEYYISEPRVDNDAKGVAPFLFAYAEILRRGE
jgi:unsaturated rhamnogalacturonyl hydrolase